MARFILVCSLFLLCITVPVNGAVAIEEQSTREITLAASPSVVHTGLTKELSLNCTFNIGPDSNFNAAMSIILSKAGPNETYTEIATVTAGNPHHVVVKDNLGGGHVAGQLVSNGVSYISYTWNTPGDQTDGDYHCEVFGINHVGHPIQASTNVDITSQVAGNTSLADRIKDLEQQVANQNIIILNQRDQLLANNHLITNQRVQLNQQQHSCMHNQVLMEAFTTYQGHTYILSKPTAVNTTKSEEVCESFGGYLAEIGDDAELHAIAVWVRGEDNRHSVIVGGTKAGHPVTGTWVYQHSGAPVNYFHWGYHEPDGQDCVYISHTDHWNMAGADCESSYVLRYLCEVPQLD